MVALVAGAVRAARVRHVLRARRVGDSVPVLGWAARVHRVTLHPVAALAPVPAALAAGPVVWAVVLAAWEADPAVALVVWAAVPAMAAAVEEAADRIK